MISAPDTDALFDRLHAATVTVHADCRGTGYVREPNDSEEGWRPVPCTCLEEVRRQVELHAAGVPREFWDAESFPIAFNKLIRVQVDRYCDDLQKARAGGMGFLMSGESGAGKTTFAAVILLRALTAGYTIGYTTTQSWVMGVVQAGRDEDLAEWRNAIARADFLVLDEVGKEYRREGSEFALAELDTLVRFRRGERLPTILCTNYTLGEFKKAYGESLWSAILDRCPRLQFQPGDYRQRIAEDQRQVKRG